MKFVQAIYDPFGELLLVPKGDSVLVELTEVRDTGEKWGSGRHLPYRLGSAAGQEEAEDSRGTEVEVTRSGMVKKNTAGAVASFCELHDRLSRFGEDWIFRGHANASWKLVPKAGRKEYRGHEENLFQAWKRTGRRTLDFS